MPSIDTDIILSPLGLGAEMNGEIIVMEEWDEMLTTVEQDLFGNHDAATLAENVSDWSEIADALKMFAEDIIDLVELMNDE